MAEREQTVPTYDTPTVPPATPPVISEKADPDEAADLPDPDGDSDFPGQTPDESVTPGGDTHDPSIVPNEVDPGEEQLDQPGETPDETPPPPPTAPD